MRVIYWGTYDLARPRNKINIRGLRSQGVDVIECHQDAWEGTTDKSGISGIVAWLKVAKRFVAAYAVLVYRYLRQPRHELVVVGYLGLIDLFVIWPWAKLRGKPVVWDALMSLYNTLIIDRSMAPENSVPARLVFLAEWVACRLSDRILVTTEERRKDFCARYGIPDRKVIAVTVGAEAEHFPPRQTPPPGNESNNELRILFYGNFTPLHGVATIVRAAKMAAGRPYSWTLIGKGRTADEVRALLSEAPQIKLDWLEWVEYEDLHRYIHQADIGLGIFGGSRKATETIPNKVYQVLATGTPLITRDSPAMRELIPENGSPGVYLVPPGDPAAILAALDEFAAQRVHLSALPLHTGLNRKVQDSISGKVLHTALQKLTGKG